MMTSTGTLKMVRSGQKKSMASESLSRYTIIIIYYACINRVKANKVAEIQKMNLI